MSRLILYNANVFTMDPACPHARSITIRDNIIESVEQEDLLPKSRNRQTKMIDCRGKTILPGFIDTHCHLRALAESQVILDLRPGGKIHSIADIKAEIKKLTRKLPPGSWIRGRGYDEFQLAEQRHLNRRDLDDVSPGHPVKLTGRTGYVHVLNSLALKVVGISTRTPDPEGGQIDRDIPDGEPTGLLYMMGDFLSRRIPSLEQEDLERGVRLANQELLTQGITSIHDVSSHNGVPERKMFEHWKKSGYLEPRVNMLMGMKNFEEDCLNFYPSDLSRNHLHMGGVKIIIDETGGCLRPAQHKLDEIVFKIHQTGLQAVCHAVEEDAIEAVCLAVHRASQKLPRHDSRHRIEHCSICPPALARKLAKCGIIVVTQPSFIYFSGERYRKTVPVRKQKYLYPLSTLIRQGVHVAAGSDFPVACANPLIGIYAASTRRTQDGNPFFMEEVVTVTDALKMYTQTAAVSSFEESLKGTLSPGKLADLVIVSDDPVRVPQNEIKDIQVEMTIIDGEMAWDQMS